MKTATILNTVLIVSLLNAITFINASDFTHRVIAGKQEFLVQTAVTRKQQQQGLMYRQNMPSSQGLLMIFERDTHVPIWMKNMFFPLDVAWMSADGVVVDLKTLPVCSQTPCPIFRSDQSARYVLEVGAGLFQLKQGDKVEIIDTSRDSLHPSNSVQ